MALEHEIERLLGLSVDDARKQGLPSPRPPDLPPELVNEVSKRYVIAYGRLTGLKL